MAKPEDLAAELRETLLLAAITKALIAKGLLSLDDIIGQLPETGADDGALPTLIAAVDIEIDRRVKSAGGRG